MEVTVKGKKLLLARPRGFCAGVEWAVTLVEKAAFEYGKPVYVRHQIVHNPRVINDLQKIGVHFVNELDEVPDDAPVFFSAHGVPPAVVEEADRRNLNYIDASCPLVKKVHHEVVNFVKSGKQVVLIGHKGHPEVIGIMGHAPPDRIHLVQSVPDAQALNIPEGTELGLVTQTTLSIFETAEIVEALKKRFVNIQEPNKSDICYATTNRQYAAIELSKKCDAVVIIGGRNSSNSASMRNTLLNKNYETVFLTESAEQFDTSQLTKAETIGITSGASTPECSVLDLVNKISSHFDVVSVKEFVVNEENIKFKITELPPVKVTIPYN
ncbi:MAG: 4-hydroxy-3-methylbut-2-enyl diphosphate reductase [Gammaproteobacteria bacterium]|nr:4-hydroxy-3-methylbut-2-enyl diphosphate reductase [Gammaproteobacteria bacterium]